MPLIDLHLDHEHLLHQAAQLLDTDVRPLRLEEELERLLRKRLAPGKRLGLEGQHPLVYLHRGRGGQELIYGLETYSLEHEELTIRLVRVAAPIAYPTADALYDFWAVPAEQAQAFQRYLRTLQRTIRVEAPEPILDPDVKQALWKNTVHFLRQDGARLARFGVRPQRGVLMVGAPGNGKTMACRWLESQCRHAGLLWRSITLQEFQLAIVRLRSRDLFEMPTPGILHFDDFDVCVQDERSRHRSADQLMFLAELDGMRLPSPAVFLFTSNAQPEEFDEAFLRPGRIDKVIAFDKPSAAMRRRLIAERWHGELIATIDLNDVVAATEGLSFAELEELKRQLVLDYLEEGRWDWEGAWRSFAARLPSDSRRESGDGSRASLE